MSKVASTLAVDDDFLTDPLKRAKHELLKRQIRREDFAMAIGERQVIHVDDLRKAISNIVGKLVTRLDTAPDVMERKYALTPVEVEKWRTVVDLVRDDLYEAVMEAMEETENQVSVSVVNLQPKNSDNMGAAAAATQKRGKGRPTNIERAARMELLS